MGRVMKRFDNWARPYNQFFREREGVPFKWGKHDCALFAADGVKAITGVDLAAEWRGKYRSLRGAMSVIDREGGTMAGFVDDRLERMPVSLAQRGDVVWREQEGPFGGALGMVAPGGVQAGFPGKVGVVLAPLTSCSIAWRV